MPHSVCLNCVFSPFVLLFFVRPRKDAECQGLFSAPGFAKISLQNPLWQRWYLCAAEKFAIPGFARGLDSSSQQNSRPDVGKGRGAKVLHESTQRVPRRGPEKRGWRLSPLAPPPGPLRLPSEGRHCSPAGPRGLQAANRLL